MEAVIGTARVVWPAMTRSIFTSLALAILAVGCGMDGGYYYGTYDRGAPQPDGDRYESVGTNPFVMAAHDPFSTFAADVDTASYDIFVRDATTGVLPDPASVRLEDYVN